MQGHWSDSARTREERLRLLPADVFSAGLRGATGGTGHWGAQAAPGGLRIDVSGFGTLAFIDQLRASDTGPDALEMAMVGFDIVREGLGAVGEVGHHARLALNEQIACDAGQYPALGAWLQALASAIDSRADFDAAIAFLEQSRTLWMTTDVLDTINLQNQEVGIAPRVWLPGLLVTLGRQPLEPADPELLRRRVESRAASARPGPAVLPDHLDPLKPQADKVVAFLQGLTALPPATQRLLDGATIELESSALCLTGASGVSAATLSRGFDLASEPAGWTLVPGPSAGDVGQELESALDLIADREAALRTAQTALDAVSTTANSRVALWRLRNDAFSRLCVAESVARGLALAALRLAPAGSGLNTGRYALLSADLRARIGLWESDGVNAPPIGGMPGPSAPASGPPPAMMTFPTGPIGAPPAGAIPPPVMPPLPPLGSFGPFPPMPSTRPTTVKDS